MSRMVLLVFQCSQLQKHHIMHAQMLTREQHPGLPGGINPTLLQSCHPPSTTSHLTASVHLY